MQEKSSRYDTDIKIKIFKYIIKILEKNPLSDLNVIEYLKENFNNNDKAQILKSYV
jgi:hypothetical protein